MKSHENLRQRSFSHPVFILKCCGVPDCNKKKFCIMDCLGQSEYDSYRHFLLDVFIGTFKANLGLCLNRKYILRSSAAVMVTELF